MSDDRKWRFDVENAPHDATIEACARADNATTGFPQYVGWSEEHACFTPIGYSIFSMRLIVWAWRPRDRTWPSEFEAKRARQLGELHELDKQLIKQLGLFQALGRKFNGKPMDDVFWAEGQPIMDEIERLEALGAQPFREEMT